MTFDPLLLAVVLGLVEFIKRLNVSGNWLLIASMLIGLALYLGYAWLPAGIVKDILSGLLLGLCASGLYDLSKRFMPAA